MSGAMSHVRSLRSQKKSSTKNTGHSISTHANLLLMAGPHLEEVILP